MKLWRHYFTLLSFLLPALTAIGIFYVAVFHFLIPSQMASLFSQKQNIVREVVNMGWQVVQSHRQAVLEGRCTEAEAKARALGDLEKLRWENGQNYLYILSNRGTMLMHPFHAEKVGRDVTDDRDEEGIYITRNALRASAENELGGFTEYRWDRPSAPNAATRKITFSRGFQPWGWVICAGVYYDDIVKEHAAASREFFWILVGTFLLVGALLGGMIWRGAQEEARRAGAEAELTRSEKRFRDIFNNTFQYIALISPDGRVVQCNDTALFAVNLPLERVEGRNFWDTPWWTHDAEQASYCRSMFEQACQTGRIVRFEAQHPSAAGEMITMDVSFKPLLEELGGEIRCVIAEARDITPLKRMEAHLHQTQKLESIGKLAGGVAHDFNNMLGGILGAADILLAKAQDPADRKFLELITQTSERAADLTGKLLAFSRQGKIENVPLDVHQAVQSAVDILERTLDRTVTIRTVLGAANAMVHGDLSQLQNVFLNMGINSAHAMPQGGELTFSTRQVDLDAGACAVLGPELEPGPYIEVRVRDTGTGIEPQHMPHIFDPFFTTKKQGEGTGLGLAAAYGTVREHHGAISVYSEVGHGTEFRIVLPQTAEAEMPPATVPALIVGQGTVLLVDDEPVIRVTTEAMLRRLGYRVLLANDGTEAIEVFRRHDSEIDLVLLDMIMPGMNGRDCFSRLCQLRPGVRVILSSGFDNTGSLEELTGMGVCAVIRKPYHTAELSQVIAGVLGRP